MRTFCGLAIVASAVLLQAQSRPAGMIEWSYQGADQAQSHYPAADQITPANAGRLARAWAPATPNRAGWADCR